MPLNLVSYDADDNGQRYFIIGGAGVLTSSRSSLPVSELSSEVSFDNWYHSSYQSLDNLTVKNFLDYIQSRKDYKVINSLSEINQSGIYIIDKNVRNLVIDSNSVGVFNNYHLVIISLNTITLNLNQFIPTKATAVLAETINFSNNLIETKGIFIGKNISTGENNNQGLKITGNLIAFSSLTNGRKWLNNRRPSLFIVFDQSLYINLLPYLSIAYYDWQQVN